MEWVKPSGVEVKTNDMPETIKYCESLGWKEKKIEIKKEEVKKVAKKKTAKKA